MLFVVPRVGNLLMVFSANHSFLARKRANEGIVQTMSNLLIRSFLVSDSLTVVHFW